MNILDKYLIRSFLNVLTFALFAFCLIYIVVDLIGFMDKFIDSDVSSFFIIKYYLYYIPYIIILSLPVAMLLASLFSVGQLARYTEIIAMSASGLSLFRILMPLFITSIIISCFALYVGEKFVPITNQKKIDVYNQYVNKSAKSAQSRHKDIYIQVQKNEWLNIAFFDGKINTGHNISVQYFNDKFNRIIKRIDAPRMVREKKSWILLNGYIRTFNDSTEQIQVFDRLEKPEFKFSSEDLAQVQKKAEEMSYWELKQFTQNIKRNGGNPDRWLVDLYLKIAFPFANFIIVLFGAPLASRKTRSGPSISFGISLLICFLYFGIIKTGQALGHNGTLSPLFSAWLGNLIFGCAAFVILFIMRR